jgi:hypothetical protein
MIHIRRRGLSRSGGGKSGSGGPGWDTGSATGAGATSAVLKNNEGLFNRNYLAAIHEWNHRFLPILHGTAINKLPYYRSISF